MNCVECGKRIDRRSTRCRACHARANMAPKGPAAHALRHRLPVTVDLRCAWCHDLTTSRRTMQSIRTSLRHIRMGRNTFLFCSSGCYLAHRRASGR